MPALPEVLARPRGGLVEMPRVQGGNAIAAGLADVAQGFNRAAADLRQYEEQDARLWKAKNDIAARTRLLKLQQDRQLSGEPLDGFGVFMETATKAAYAELGKDAPNEMARQLWEMASMEAVGEFGIRATNAEAEYRVLKIETETGQTLDGLAQAALIDPGNAPSYVAQAHDLLAGARVPLQSRERMRKQIEGIAVAGVQGLIERNPYEAMKRLQSGYYTGSDIGAGSLATLMNAAQAGIKSREAEARQRANDARLAAAENATAYMAGAEDYLAYRASGGLPDPQLEAKYSPSAIAGLGVPQAGGWAKQSAAALARGDAVMEARTAATPEERAAVAEKYKTLASDPENFMADQKTFEAVMTGLSEFERRLAERPGDVAAQSGRVQDAIKGGSGVAVASAMIAEQERLGVPEWKRVALPETFAETLSQRILSLPPERQAQEIQAIRAEYGSMWFKVWPQLGAKLPGSLAVAAVMPAGRPSIMLADAAGVPEDELKAGLDRNVVKEITDALGADPTIVNYGRSFANQAGAARTMASVTEATRKLALQYARSGEAGSGAEAVSMAAKEIAGGVSFVEMNGGVFQVPKNKDARIVEGVARSILDNPPSDFDLPPSTTGMVESDIRAAYADALRRNGTWISDKEGRGLYLWDGDAMVTRNGAPVLFTWDELSAVSTVPGVDTWQR